MMNRSMASSYLEWAKLHSHARYNLATSGIRGYPSSELDVPTDRCDINGPTLYGYEPLQQRLAAKLGVAPSWVVAAQGTTFANHLAMATILSPGDEVLIERPVYGPILELASYLGALVRRFDRRIEDGFQVDPDEVRRQTTSRTRLIVLTNLHNPTGVFTDNSTLASLGEIASGVGARILVDEVYLGMLFDQVSTTCVHLGELFVATGSLTKAYGLGGLRCGWILAEPSLAEQMWRLNDLFGAVSVHAGELLSVIALDQIHRIAARAKKIVETNTQRFDETIAPRKELELVSPRWGTVRFPRLRDGSCPNFCERLREEYEISVVPGEFFEMPQHFRIGLGGDPEMTRDALEKLAVALAEM